MDSVVAPQCWDFQLDCHLVWQHFGQMDSWDCRVRESSFSIASAQNSPSDPVPSELASISQQFPQNLSVAPTDWYRTAAVSSCAASEWRISIAHSKGVGSSMLSSTSISQPSQESYQYWYKTYSFRFPLGSRTASPRFWAQQGLLLSPRRRIPVTRYQRMNFAFGDRQP